MNRFAPLADQPTTEGSTPASRRIPLPAVRTAYFDELARMLKKAPPFMGGVMSGFPVPLYFFKKNSISS
jgi:hypothetical protein